MPHDRQPGQGQRQDEVGFRTFQWVETGVFVALALVLAGCCLRWLIRRIA
jgi:hypothetical protein